MLTILAVVYNAAMLVVDVIALRRFRDRPVRALALTGTVALVLATILGPGQFGAMRLLAYGWFGHGVLVLGGFAVLTRGWKRIAAGLAATVVAGVAVFAFAIEPFRLEVTRFEIESPKVATPLRVVLIADLQTDSIGAYEKRVLARVMEESPDLIVMAGDYVHEYDARKRAEVRTSLRAALEEVGFGAEFGVIAVAGNTDSDDWPELFAGFPVTTVETTARFERGGIAITALELWQSFDTEARVLPSERFHIVVGHSPDFALGEVEADLLLAGHTHGGQVQLPFIGPVVTLSRVPRAWASGRTEIGEGKTLIVSRGIGMERGPAPRLRFLCRPEVVVIEIVPQE